MIIFTLKSKVKAPIDHVFQCMTDIEYLKEMALVESPDIKSVEYNKKSPFKPGEKIVFIAEKAKTIITVEKVAQPNYLKLQFSPYKTIEDIFGGGYIEAHLSTKGDETHYFYNFVSDKNPKGFIKVFIKILGMFYKLSCISMNKKFNSYVLSSA